MPTLDQEQLVRRPRDQVFAFFADAANLERLTPATLRFSILTPAPIAMRPGATIDYRLRLFGVPFLWRTVIEVWDPPHRFVDVQERGPYRSWRHTHTFTAAPNAETLVADHVEYELPFGPLGMLVHRLFVRRQLAGIFAFRRKAIEGWLTGAEAPAT